MVLARTTGIASAAALVLSGATMIYAQSSGSADDHGVTVTGCLMSESAYRQAHNLGKGALNGAGLGDEFVIVDATTAPASNVPKPNDVKRERPAPSPSSASAAQCAERGNGQAYRITGHREEELKGWVGRRLEVTGTLKHDSSASTGTVAAGKLPEELDMADYREVAAGAPAAAVRPSAPEPATQVSRSDTRPDTSAPPATSRRTTRRGLPKTASDAPLVALIGILSLAAGSGLWLTRRSSLL